MRAEKRDRFSERREALITFAPFISCSKNFNIDLSQFQKFKQDIAGIKLPEKFTFPFYYQPHPLAVIAANEVQFYLENQTDFEHDFGLEKEPNAGARGKMFGVLIVKNLNDELGYLAAFSGNLADKSLPEKFVPPLFDMHDPNGFYRMGEEELNVINQQIRDLEADPQFIESKKVFESKTNAVQAELNSEQAKRKALKKERKARRKEAEQTLLPTDFVEFQKQLARESYRDRFSYKDLVEARNQTLLPFQQKLEVFTSKIAHLKAKRKRKSAILQQKIFDQYQFLNLNKTPKSLTEIFPISGDQKPPGGAGDCSAPKLLQYAFSNDLKPISMAEFWWGVAPPKEIRQHKNFYPACQGRCKPILAHMLEGLKMDKNLLITNLSEKKEIKIVFQDDSILVINKPPELLSTPGKDVSDSVYTRMKKRFPDATGPLLVHRLDMSTSGILLIAKTKEAHKILQNQFLKRTIKKRYVALLDGNIEKDSGYVELPLRVDLDDRPRQLVCYEYGKPAKTQWKIIERLAGKTRVHFYPITGRTHQLRMHASHTSGLNTPIVGDDLYGKKANRLHLHAEFIEFTHPTTEKKMRFTVEADF